MCKVFVGSIDKGLESIISQSLEWIDWEKIVHRDSRVFIKPNFTFPTYKPGITTSPKFLEVLVKVLKTRCTDITVGETDGGYYAWKAEEAFLNHELYRIQKKYDIKVMNLYDSEAEQIQAEAGGKTYDIPLPKVLLEDTDIFITVPVLKAHTMTRFTFGLKNQWGCILDPYRMRYHHVFKEVIIKLNEVLNPKILISDPYNILIDKGPMEGTVVQFNTLITSNNIFAFEETGCRLLGVKTSEIDYLKYAQNLGKFPAFESVQKNASLEPFCTYKYNLSRTLKDKLICMVFNSSFLTYLFYYSKFGLFIHKVYYSLIGKKTKVG